VSLWAVEGLGTYAILIKPYRDCGKDNPWGYTEEGSAIGAPPDEAFQGGVEITKTEDVSKNGLCFVSEKTYFMDQGIKAVFPHAGGQQNFEMSARIVQQIGIKATQPKIYEA
jgi:hypothetical protein